MGYNRTEEQEMWESAYDSDEDILAGEMDKEMTLEKKIECILLNQYPRGKKYDMPKTIDLILEVFEDEKQIKEE